MMNYILTLEALKYFYINQETKGLFSIRNHHSSLALSVLFEYLWYDYAAVINISLFHCVIHFRRQKFDPRALRVN